MSVRATENLEQVASRVYATYRAAALRQVARGAWNRNEAGKRLQPWAAIALLCGGEVAGITDRLDELCTRIVHLKPSSRSPLFEVAQRAVLAVDLCPRSMWEPTLARARAEASIRADALRGGDDKDALSRALSTWRDLDLLAHDLDLPLRLLCEVDAAAAALSERIAA